MSGRCHVRRDPERAIGLATAARFIEERARVFIAGRRQTELDAAVRRSET